MGEVRVRGKSPTTSFGVLPGSASNLSSASIETTIVRMKFTGFLLIAFLVRVPCMVDGN